MINLGRHSRFAQLCAAGVFGGATLALAYPPVKWWLLSAIALVPLFSLLILGRFALSWRQVFMAAYLFALVWHVSALWWIGHVTIAGMLVLCMYISFLLALALTLGWWLMRTGLPPFLALPTAWMVFEAVLSYLFTGFPWLLLGYAWRPWIAMTQVADIAGVYAVSFLVVLINAAFAQALAGRIERAPYMRRQAGVLCMVAVYAVFIAYGVWRLHALDAEKPARTVRIACIQANIPSLVKHDFSKDGEILQRHCRMTRDAVRTGVDLVIWSETAVPGYFSERLASYRALTNIVKETAVPLLTGLPWYETDAEGEPVYFNSAGIIEPSGIIAARYDKIHLVVFGEYVPFEQWLPFMKKLTPIAGSFSPGRMVRTLPLAMPPRAAVSFGPLICFEDVFGYLSRDMARAGADVLVSLANDGWFFSSPGPYQHVAVSAFRAIETRKPLVRCTNSGVSTVIDRAGRTRVTFSHRGIFTDVSGIMHDTVPVHKPMLTFYAKHGDWFLALCVLFVSGASMRGAIRARTAGGATQ